MEDAEQSLRHFNSNSLEVSETTSSEDRKTGFTYNSPKGKFSFLFSSTAVYIFILVDVLLVSGGFFYFVLGNSKKRVAPAIKQTNTLSATPTIHITPTTSQSLIANTNDPGITWVPYKFAALGMTVRYPPDWYVQVSASSDGSGFTLQNFKPLAFGQDAATKSGNFALKFSRWRVGLRDFATVKAELAKDNGQEGSYNGKAAGKMTISNMREYLINGFNAYSRYVSYASVSAVLSSEVYIHDGRDLVVKIVPTMNDTEGRSIYNQIISTFTFTP